MGKNGAYVECERPLSYRRGVMEGSRGEGTVGDRGGKECTVVKLMQK